MRQGVIPSQMIAKMVSDGQIQISAPLDVDQIQPASLDLRLGQIAYRVRALTYTHHRDHETKANLEYSIKLEKK